VIRFGRADIGKIALDERMAMITEALRSDPSISDRRLARQLGVNGHLVGRVRRQLERAGEIQARD
jgi:DNA-binding transcriptional regulator YhcF (GntR family)